MDKKNPLQALASVSGRAAAAERCLMIDDKENPATASCTNWITPLTTNYISALARPWAPAAQATLKIHKKTTVIILDLLQNKNTLGSSNHHKKNRSNSSMM